MKRWFLTPPGFALAAVLALFCIAREPAAAQTLYAIGYGVNGPSTLYTVDPASGAATSIGPVGFDRCGGMDFNAAGALFATCERSGGISVLVRVDVVSGLGTEVGPTGLSHEVADITFRADGTLFAYDAANNLHRLHTGTGAATLVGLTSHRATNGNVLSFVPAGTLYGLNLNLVVGSTDLYLTTLDPATGAETSVVLFGSTTNDYFHAIDAHPETGILFGIRNQSAGSGPGTRLLESFDPVSLAGKTIGPTESTLYALAWGPLRGSSPPAIVEVPALSPLGLLLLGTILALAAGVALRRA